jgi:hypothetical protein
VRERIVPMTFSGSVVAKMNLTCSGGSSTSLSRALKPCGHHVRLVEDEDLEAVARGGEDRALAQIAGVVDTVVGCRVDLDHIERPSAAAAELDTAVADAAGRVGRALPRSSSSARGCGPTSSCRSRADR